MSYKIIKAGRALTITQWVAITFVAALTIMVVGAATGLDFWRYIGIIVVVMVVMGLFRAAGC